MDEFDDLLEKAKIDVRRSLLVWTEILEEILGNKIAYVYAKGSAIKQWHSPVDYVPGLSDIDIHVMLKEGTNMFSQGNTAFSEAMQTSRRFEELFIRSTGKYIHIPRTQLTLLNDLAKDPLYVPPRSRDVLAMIGYFPEFNEPSPEAIRNIDYNKILELESFLESLPMSIIDRMGFDLWVVIRRMCWRVSPTPTRLLTQIIDDPQEVWSWNRTKIRKELESQGFSQISKYYEAYYMAGWRLFLSEFRNSDVFRDIVVYGYQIMKESLDATKKIKGMKN
ncbi:MAG: hypothetical protein QG670_1751 [Thermoproteota archaeon]|nr:hypothetical protein [Thermoproteota archaeon]